jgi:hypothetical protein
VLNDLFGSETLIDGDLLRFLLRLAVNLTFVAMIVHVVYHRLYRNREYVFTYYLFNLITFGMCLLLRKVPIELGFALGLFAVFGILRYRTEAIRIRDLTYLFIVIGLGILNGVSNKKISVAELLFANAMIVGATALLELRPGKGAEHSTPMLYDNLLLLRPGSEAQLYADLQSRTGLDVVRVDILRYDMLRDAAEITVYYAVKRK